MEDIKKIVIMEDICHDMIYVNSFDDMINLIVNNQSTVITVDIIQQSPLYKSYLNVMNQTKADQHFLNILLSMLIPKKIPFLKDYFKHFCVISYIFFDNIINCYKYNAITKSMLDDYMYLCAKTQYLKFNDNYVKNYSHNDKIFLFHIYDTYLCTVEFKEILISIFTQPYFDQFYDQYKKEYTVSIIESKLSVMYNYKFVKDNYKNKCISKDKFTSNDKLYEKMEKIQQKIDSMSTIQKDAERLMEENKKFSRYIPTNVLENKKLNSILASQKNMMRILEDNKRSSEQTLKELEIIKQKLIDDKQYKELSEFTLI